MVEQLPKQDKGKPVFRYSRLLHIRWFLCLPVLLHLLGVATSFAIRPMSFTAAQSVVIFFEVLGPYWPITFGLAFIMLVLALYKKQYIEKALFFAMAVFIGLFVATTYGVIFAGGGWIAATGALAGAVTSWTMGVVFNRGRD